MAIKKILMLADPYADNLAYMMFDGLYKTVGKDNILIYPFIKYFQGGIDEWLQNDKRRFTIPFGYGCKHESKEKMFEELVNMIDEFDIIYLSSTRTYAVNALRQFIERCGSHIPPIICSEGEDGSNLDNIGNIKRLYNIAVCFKRDLTQSELDKRKDLYPLYPLPFSAAIDNIPLDNPKDIDICVQFGDSHPIRENIIKILLINNIHNKYNTHITINSFQFNQEKNLYSTMQEVLIPYMPYNHYMNFMSRSKINIIARGNGYDTIRRLEAPSFSGLVLSDNIPIITPDPFINGQHIVYYNDDLNNLIYLIEYYLSHDEERVKIGKAGKEHCMMYHTTEARARYFLNKVEEHIKK